MGNFKDSKLETLAKRGNGNYAYLDNINEAEKVLVKEVTQTFILLQMMFFKYSF
jgi:Ca-activated chloride channel family protein